MTKKYASVYIENKEYSYFCEGEGMPCIVVGIASFYSPTIADNLKSIFKFFYVDLWWTGIHPDLNVDNISMDDLVEQIEALRKALGLEKIAIWGHSVFGLLALQYCAKYSQYVTIGLIIASPGTWTHLDILKAEAYWKEHASLERQALYQKNMKGIEARKAKKILTDDELGLASYLANAPKYWMDPMFDCSYLWDNIYTNRKLLNHFMNNIISDYDPSDTYTKLECQIFVAMGLYDYALPPVLWEHVKSKFMKIQFHVFEKSAHYPQMDESERFFELIKIALT
jgi:proline iminopeptidase